MASVREATRLRVILEYDGEADAAYLRLGEGRVAETIEVERGVLLDLDEKGRVVGVEVLEASRRLGSVVSKLHLLASRVKRVRLR